MAFFQNRIRRKKVGKYSYFSLIVPAWLSGGKTRKWEYYRTKEAAVARAVQLNAALVSRERATVLTSSQEADARRAFELLQDLGLDGTSLRACVEVAAPLLQNKADLVGLGQFLADFAREKDDSWSAASKRSFRAAERMIVEEFGAESPLSGLTSDKLGRWLASRFATAGYRAQVYRTLSPAFNWGVRRGVLDKSPLELVEKPRVIRGAVDVLSPSEARRAMEVCPTRCVAAVALMLFGGVRPKEVERLTWGDIRADFVHLRPGITKTAQVRNIEINATLAAWLDCVPRGCDGERVVPANWARHYQSWRAAAGIGARQDVLRHSYATYHLAMWRDESALKSNMGHSRGSDVLFRHYRAAATPAQAREFWAILPTKKH